jgi:hypothetical protein
MKLKRLFSTVALIIASSISQAEIKSFEVKNINSYSSNIYPTLDLNGLDQIKAIINHKEVDPSNPAALVDIMRVEFNFPNANNLIVENLTSMPDNPKVYRAIVTSPWVFKKVLVEFSADQLFDGIHFNYRVIVMDNTSNINNFEQTQGLELFSGDAELVNVSKKVVDEISGRRYLGKPLTLRLLNNINPEGVQIEATWFGHGTRILTLPSAFDARLSPVALILEEQRIKVRFNDAYNGPESSEEDIHVLLEQAFGPLPDLEVPQP